MKQREQMMSTPLPLSGARAAATSEDLLRILGEIDQRKALEILALRPTLADVEEAAVWASGDGDVLARSGRPLTGTAAEIFDILIADEEEPPPKR